MTEGTRRTSLATLAVFIVLACLGSATGIALVAVQYTRWDWLTGLLGAVLSLLFTAVIWLILDAVDQWIDRLEREARANGESQ
jgi:hypothetical protein